MITGVKVRGWCSAKGEWVKGQATSGDLANFSGGTTGAAMAESAFGEWVHEIDNAKVGSSSRAKAVAVAELQSKANTFVTGTVECPGVPDAVSGARLTIQEAGSPLSGDFVIHETIHSLTPDAGYRTTIHFLSDSLPA